MCVYYYDKEKKTYNEKAWVLSVFYNKLMPGTQLQQQWLQKYHPRKVSDVVGNTRVIRSLKEWLNDIQKYKEDPCSFDTPPVPIVYLYGPGGIGKTALAQVILKHFNYELYEMNSGEVRSKKRMQDILDKILNNHNVNMMKKENRRQTMSIIMDEIDGMSCGDKGGLHELFHSIDQLDKCIHPVICIGNRPYEKNFSTSLYTEYHMRNPSEHEIKQRLRHICKMENVQIDDMSLLWIIKYNNLDVRRTIHFLQEVVYHYGNDQTKNITIEDIDLVKDITSQTKVDCNIFSIIRNMYSKQHSLQELSEMYHYDEMQITMMMHDNLSIQLSQKKINQDDNIHIHMNVLHNMCHLDVLNTHYSFDFDDTHATLCCGYANALVANLSTSCSVPKKIQYTNILTKIANHSNVLSTFNDISNQLRINSYYLHYAIPILIKDLCENTSNIKNYRLTISHMEKIIQVYNKWVSEISKSQADKVSKIITRIKKEWKKHVLVSTTTNSS